MQKVNGGFEHPQCDDDDGFEHPQCDDDGGFEHPQCDDDGGFEYPQYDDDGGFEHPHCDDDGSFEHPQPSVQWVAISTIYQHDDGSHYAAALRSKTLGEDVRNYLITATDDKTDETLFQLNTSNCDSSFLTW